METIGKYKVIKELGAGGFGAVYLAEDPRLGTQVAIKVFRVKDENLAGVAISASEDATGVLKARFLAEARVLETLSHNPYIVSLKEFDELEDGTPYYVMPYLSASLEQETGKDAFTRGKLEDTPKELHPRKLAVGRATEILQQILEGMNAVHQAGLIHRDIKPANILFDSTGKVQICDFGIAKLPDEDHSISGVGMGSRNYMSQEQRESAKDVTAASDVYSIGVLAYRMLTGQLPAGKFKDVITFAPEVGGPLNQLIDKALSQHEAQRPKDAGEMLKAFNNAVTAMDDSVQEEEPTGTWVGEAGIKVAPELTPIKEELEVLLRAEGYAEERQLEGIQAMAMVAGLSEEELDSFIRQTEEALENELRPFRNWLKLVQQQAQKDLGELSDASKKLLLKAGALVKYEEKILLEKLRTTYAQYKAEKPVAAVRGSEQPAQPTSRSTPISQPPVKDHKPALAEVSPPQLKTARKSEKPTNTFTDKTLDMGGVKFVLKAIPGGSFMMGSDNGYDHEKPIHSVNISPFYLMETQFTFALIDRCIELGMSLRKPDDMGWGRGQHPAFNVSWNDITETILPWLNSQIGPGFRLPSEAEWEYACRAGSTTTYSWGDEIDKSMARYGENIDKIARYGDNRTARVKSYPANAFGLYDMHGNVWEWVQDCWNDSYDGAPSDGSAWQQGDFDEAVLRGGNWNMAPFFLRSACRFGYDRPSRTFNTGFRLAQDL